MVDATAVLEVGEDDDDVLNEARSEFIAPQT